MPPYSLGRCGAHSPASLTLALISSRSSMLRWRARSRSSSSSSPDRRERHRVSSSGRISALMKSAVRRRMSLTAGSRPAIGVTLIATGAPWSRVRWSPDIMAQAPAATGRHPVASCGPGPAAGRYGAMRGTDVVHLFAPGPRQAHPRRGGRARRPQLLRRPVLHPPVRRAPAAGAGARPLPAEPPGRPGRHARSPAGPETRRVCWSASASGSARAPTRCPSARQVREMARFAPGADPPAGVAGPGAALHVGHREGPAEGRRTGTCACSPPTPWCGGGASAPPCWSRRWSVIDEDGLPCYLETQKEDNLAYYRRFGFEETERLSPSRHGPPLFTMTRPAR